MRVLVVAGSQEQAALAGDALTSHFEEIVYSTDPGRQVADFDRHRAPLCVLAFDHLALAEQYLLSLEQSSEALHTFTHRRLVLCHAAEADRAVELCLRGRFDDYVVFWPTLVDAPRLLLAAHRAAGELQALALRSQRLGDWVAEVHRLEQFEARLSSTGAWMLEHLDLALESIQGLVPAGAAVDVGLERGLETVKVKLGWIRHWALNLNHEWHDEVSAVRRLRALAGRARPVILVVDDDAFQHKLLRRLLGDEELELLSASTVGEAMAVLQVRKVDCILMDIGLPDFDGIEAVHMIKSTSANDSIAVVMLTGSRDESALQRSLDAGAIGFIAKPLNRSMLISRLRGVLPNVG